MTDTTFTTVTERHLTSRVRSDGVVELAIIESDLRPPGPGEVVVRVEATPVNPSDIGLLLAGADPAGARKADEGSRTLLDLPPDRHGALDARLDDPLPVGNEGAGTVVAAGPGAEDLVGRVVSAVAGGMWATHRLIHSGQLMVLQPGTDPRDAASSFVNPLTALGIAETAVRDGHLALVHTAAASNLGRMLIEVCRADGLALVNVVRRDEQADLLRGLGAEHVCVSSAPDFKDQLDAAIAATGARVVFDAVGGGRLVGQVLRAMERVLGRHLERYSPYGSPVRKQAHVYGRLDPSPLEIDLGIGFAWDISGWLLTPFLADLAPGDFTRLRDRVAAELTTTFASSYGAEITLDDVLDPDVIAGFGSRGTGRKYLIRPF
ncbi:zinc-binding dehydrogenase [Nocardioides dilutus]